MIPEQVIKPIIESKIITCTACLHPNLKGTCLDLTTTVKVIIGSKTRSLVYHVPLDNKSLEDLNCYNWSFIDLLENLPNRDYFLLSNTSRSKNTEDAIERALAGAAVFNGLPHSFHQKNPIIKLEVLNDSLKSDDEDVIAALDTLIKKYKFVVFPLISPNVNSLEICIELGAPLIRILSGKIGSMSGLLNKNYLRQLAKKSTVPLFFEGGIGTPTHVKEALNLGASGVLINTAFQRSINPVQLAKDVRSTIDIESKKLNQSVLTYGTL